MTIEIQNEMEQQFRAVCANFDAPGHHEHRYIKDTYELAERYARKMDTSTPGPESPFVIQTRLLSEWEYAVETEERTDEVQTDSS